MAKTTGQMLARLKTLISESGRNYYERISLAAALLDDKVWVAAEFSGDAYKAAETLEVQYFHDLCSMWSLWDFLGVYRKFPDEQDWRRHEYHLGKLLDLCRPAPEPRRPRTVIKKADHEAIVQRAKELEYQVGKEIREKTQFKTEADRLRDEVVALREENTRLKGRIEELERLLDRKYGKVGVT